MAFTLQAQEAIAVSGVDVVFNAEGAKWRRPAAGHARAEHELSRFLRGCKLLLLVQRRWERLRQPAKRPTHPPIGRSPST